MNAANPGYLIHREQDCLSVEAWSAWHLPFMKLTPAQSGYRAELRSAILGLKACGALHATYTSHGVLAPQEVKWAPDLENVLFYNLGTSVFREAACDAVRFVRKNERPPASSTALSFAPRHHVRYQVGGRETWPKSEATLVAWAQVDCVEMKDLKDLAHLWRSFKAAMACAPDQVAAAEGPFTLRMLISVPEDRRINLTEAMKPLTDAFMSALHHYEGAHLDAVVDRLSACLNCSPEMVRELLMQTRVAVLGPRAVPHLRGEGLQWSPADDLLAAGEFVRETSASDVIRVSGQLYTNAVVQ